MIGGHGGGGAVEGEGVGDDAQEEHGAAVEFGAQECAGGESGGDVGEGEGEGVETPCDVSADEPGTGAGECEFSGLAWDEGEDEDGEGGCDGDVGGLRPEEGGMSGEGEEGDAAEGE